MLICLIFSFFIFVSNVNVIVMLYSVNMEMDDDSIIEVDESEYVDSDAENVIRIGNVNVEHIIQVENISTQSQAQTQPSSSSMSKSSSSTSRMTNNETNSSKTTKTRRIIGEQSFPKGWEYLEEYFKDPVISIAERKLTAICRKCSKSYSCKIDSASNLKRHYKVAHVTLIATNSAKSESDSLSKKQRQLTLKETLRKIKTQADLDRAITKYIYKGLHSFREVEEEDFIELILGCLDENLQLFVLDRKQLVERIHDEYIIHQQHLQKTLHSVNFLSMTADVWKSYNRSFIGMTVHWLDETLCRKTAVLALKQMEFAITYREIGEVIQNVLNQYNIAEKITTCTTDNGSNFLKAFRVFGQNDFSLRPIEAEDNDSDCEIECAVNDLDFVEVLPAFQEPEMNLPRHQRCASHTLNLLATTDAGKFKFTSDSNKQDGEPIAFVRCRNLWNAQNRTTKTADLIKQKLGIYLPTPNATRWNSFYDALAMILQHQKNVEVVSKQLFPNNHLNNDDFTFIQEYCDIMGLIATALDDIQGEKSTYMGNFLPVIYSLRRSLCELKKEQHSLSRDMKLFLNHMISCLEDRFKDDWIRDELLISSVVHPLFKIHWIKNSDIEKYARKCVEDVLKTSCECKKSNVAEAEANVVPKKKKKKSIYDFDVPEAALEKPRDGCMLSEFLLDECKMETLDKYPCIKKVFIQYNVALASSAAIERIFSVGGNILSKKRTKLCSSRFEEVVFLHVGQK